MKAIVELWTPVLLEDGIFKDDYLVSNLGRVKQRYFHSDGTWGFKLMHIVNGKRPYVRLKNNDRRWNKSVAKLVLSSFHYREGCECAKVTYLDGNMKNCELSNLRYTSDKLVYDRLDKEKKSTPDKKSSKPLNKKEPLLKSCHTCAKCPCMAGMETFSTDFGANGCNDYKPRETNIS